MKKATFTKAQFLLSCLNKDDFPQLRDAHGRLLPEIAFVGRSNVGKSSLINHLLNNSLLAKVSSSPGKTQTLNFFLIDEQLLLVDLPGFGYAKTSKETKLTWSKAIDDYLSHRKTLKLILQLIDIRHPPSLQDQQFYEWALHRGKPLCLILTKKDKILKTLVPKHTEEIQKALSSDISPCIPYSIKDGEGRKSLIGLINDHLFSHKGKDAWDC